MPGNCPCVEQRQPLGFCRLVCTQRFTPKKQKECVNSSHLCDPVISALPD